jgi:hypothetical protein
MGYTTDFTGKLVFNKPLDEETRKLWTGLASSRRMKRDIVKLAEMHSISVEEAIKKWCRDGSLYFNEADLSNYGQTRDLSIIDYNSPPVSQPGLWLKWVYDVGGNALIWNDGEKFYDYVAWLLYLIDTLFMPRGYLLNGQIEYQGEDPDDRGTIYVKNNIISFAENDDAEAEEVEEDVSDVEEEPEELAEELEEKEDVEETGETDEE